MLPDSETTQQLLQAARGMVFLLKASILSGAFYVPAAAMFLTGVVMALMPLWPVTDLRIALFGITSGLSFFLPGLKYQRQAVLRASASPD